MTPKEAVAAARKAKATTSPGLPLLVKLGSIAVHAEEYLSEDGHLFDRKALLALLSDPEVKAWRAAMDADALLPLKRRA